jgi:phage FluMu protein Com
MSDNGSKPATIRCFHCHSFYRAKLTLVHRAGVGYLWESDPCPVCGTINYITRRKR